MENGCELHTPGNTDVDCYMGVQDLPWKLQILVVMVIR